MTALSTAVNSATIHRVEERELQRKRDETQQRIAAALERIATAMEWQGGMAVSGLGLGRFNSRTHQVCGNCGAVFPIGSIHVCNAVNMTTAEHNYLP